MVNYGGIGEQEIKDYLEDYREIEMEELEYMYPGCSLADAVMQSIANSHSEMLYSARVNGKLCCIGGVCPTELGGNVWFLATNELRKHRFMFPTEMQKFGIIDRMLRRYGKLYNYISMHNTRGIEWIKRIGFTVDEPDCDGKCYFERLLIT